MLYTNWELRINSRFLFPDIQINKIEFQICNHITAECFVTISYPITKVRKNRVSHPDVFRNPLLVFFEVTRFLQPLYLYENILDYQDTKFKIESTSIPEDITFSLQTIFRKGRKGGKGGTIKDQITVNWANTYYKITPFFKVRYKRETTVIFSPGSYDGNPPAYQFEDKDAFHNCHKIKRKLWMARLKLNKTKNTIFRIPAWNAIKQVNL